MHLEFWSQDFVYISKILPHAKYLELLKSTTKARVAGIYDLLKETPAQVTMLRMDSLSHFNLLSMEKQCYTSLIYHIN